MKKKLILSVAFAISLLPMLMNQYGGLKGVQEITGMINLINPIGILSVISFLVGVWFPFEKNSIQLAFPEFYIGLAVSLIIVVAYFVINKIIKE